MKEDYLWDKTGSDSEIEDLEDSLKSFRISNTNAPTLPQKTFTVDENSLQKKRPFWLSFQFVSASFASLAFTFFAIVTFQFINTGEPNVAINDSQQNSEKTVTEKPINTESKPIAKKPVNDVAVIQPKLEKVKLTRKTKVKKRVVKAKKLIRTKVKPKRFVARKIKSKSTKPKVETVKLTKEEKDAYDQLMRALSITGSQMRIVQEKINGVEVNADR